MKQDVVQMHESGVMEPYIFVNQVTEADEGTVVCPFPSSGQEKPLGREVAFDNPRMHVQVIDRDQFPEDYRGKQCEYPDSDA